MFCDFYVLIHMILYRFSLTQVMYYSWFISDVVCRSFVEVFLVLIILLIYVATKATYIRLLHGKIGFLGVFFGPSSVKRGQTHIVLG